MPLCHFSIRSLLRNPSRSSLRQPLRLRPIWPRTQSSWGIGSSLNQKDELGSKDFEAEYLDFLLAESDASQSTGRSQMHTITTDGDKAIRGLMPNAEASYASKQLNKTTLKVGHSQTGISEGRQIAPVPMVRKRSTQQERIVQYGKLRPQRKEFPAIKFLSFRARRRADIAAYKLRLKRRRETISLARSANANLQMSRKRFGKVWTKLVSLRSSRETSSAFSFGWNQKFAFISSRYDRGIPPQLRRSQAELKGSKGSSKSAELVLANIRAGHANVFQGITAKKENDNERLRLWTQVALWLLAHKPMDTLSFLKATHVSPYPPTAFVQDSLQYLAWYFTSPDNTSSQQISALVDGLPLLAMRDDGEHLRFDDTFCTDLIPHCNEEQVLQLYHAIKNNSVRIQWQAWLQFAAYFNKKLHLEEGLDALLQAKNTGADLEKMPFLSNCSTLLRTAIRQPGGFRVCLRIVDNLVEMGVRLNTQLCNIIMLNAVESNDLKTATDVYQSFTRHGLRPDNYTFAILLKGCKLSIDNTETLNSTIRDAIEHTQVLKQPVVATEILHCLALHHSKHHPESSFGTVADAFAQMFDLESLQQLGIALPSLSKPSRPAEPRMKPTPQPVQILLAVYLDHLYLQHRSTRPAHQIYQRFRALADKGIEPFSSMLRNDYIFNTFLLAFIKTKKGLLHGAELIKDMQRAPQDMGSQRACRPTVQTWSIFLNGFTIHGQMKLAEQVLTYMTRQGIKPDQTAWNTLAAGYAGRQDIDGALDVLRRMEADGSVWDEFTFRGLRRARDHEKLTAELKKRKRVATDIDFTADLKEGLEAKLATVEGPSVLQKEEQDVLAGESAVDDRKEGAEQTSYIPFNAILESS